MPVRMILPTGTKAPDANLIDGIDSSGLLQNSGGNVSGNIEFTDDGEGIAWEAGGGTPVAMIYKKIGGGLTIKPHSDATGLVVETSTGNNIFQVKTDGTGVTYNGQSLYTSTTIAKMFTGADFTIAANANPPKWTYTHNYNSLNYTIIVELDTAERHHYFQNKTANAIDIYLDDVSLSTVNGMVTFVGR